MGGLSIVLQTSSCICIVISPIHTQSPIGPTASQSLGTHVLDLAEKFQTASIDLYRDNRSTLPFLPLPTSLCHLPSINPHHVALVSHLRLTTMERDDDEMYDSDEFDSYEPGWYKPDYSAYAYKRDTDSPSANLSNEIEPVLSYNLKYIPGDASRKCM